MNRLIIILLFSLTYSFDSKDVLNDLNQNNKWVLIEDGDKKIFEYYNEKIGGKYLKVEKNIDIDPLSVFNTVKNIGKYNSITSNKNLYTDLVYVNEDTLYGYQLVKNSLPFSKDRHYVFKMYQQSENRIDWYILKKNNIYISNYFNDDIKTLTLGAGSWIVNSINEKKVLINKIFVDDEISMPDLLIHRFRINHVVDIFNDVLNDVKKKEEKE